MTAKPHAVITGASSGIGAAFAACLASNGYDLTLIARRRGRLAELAARLARATPVTVSVHAADLTDPAGLRSAEDQIAAIPNLDLLVNNAGFAGYGPFAGLDPAVAAALIAVHVTAPTRLTRAALPAMAGRGRGAVINIASLLAFSGSLPPGPLPCRATYAAAKAYLVTFTCALAAELAGTGVRVQVCCPGPAATEFLNDTGIDPARLPVTPMDPVDVVAASLAALDLGETVCIPGLDDPAAVEDYHNTARQLMQASGRALARRYRTTPEPETCP
ncbi:MAG TPA: SDR family NAD(P)-dependent oxidoreductase [Streptosporangiaceae bacterium]|nr:SDR family NAD(P)-dependent oxidoreductase [Streptosporangiaceae bacterium]